MVLKVILKLHQQMGGSYSVVGRGDIDVQLGRLDVGRLVLMRLENRHSTSLVNFQFSFLISSQFVQEVQARWAAVSQGLSRNSDSDL